MVRIIELIDDFKLNQEIIGRKPKYVEKCIWRLKRWQEFMVQECEVTDVEEAIEPMYIQYRQQLGTEKPITLNNQISMLKVFFSYLIDEEYHEEKTDRHHAEHHAADRVVPGQQRDCRRGGDDR